MMSQEKIDIAELSDGQNKNNETISEKAEEVAKAFNSFFDIKRLRDGIFTSAIEWLLRALFFLFGIIVIAVCFYILRVAISCDVAEFKAMISQIGGILVSFGGWATASVLAFKKK